MYTAIRPVPALTSITLRANSVHPMMSFPTPADRIMIPTLVSSSLSSVKIQQSTGNTVTVIVVRYRDDRNVDTHLVKSMKCVNLML